MDGHYYVYLLTNRKRRALYLGVTNDLRCRLSEHRLGINDGFTKRYNIHLLMYYETFSDPLSAIAREKQMKGGSRAQKVALIEKGNPNWEDLSARW